MAMRYGLIGLAVFVIVACRSPMSLEASEILLGMSGGVYTVPVQVNRSITMQFLVDPGASVVVIPLSVLRNLIRNGSVTEGDVVGVAAATIADSSSYLMAKVRLRELRIGDSIVRDVIAAVSPGLTLPLLGQSFFRRFATVTIDNQRQALILSEGGWAPTVQFPPTASGGPYSSYPATGAYSGGGYGPPGYSLGNGR
jgi:hypothetical protein